MLISFTVGNYLSFKDNTTISFLASKKINELKSNYNNVLGNNILNSLAIFGNNASGKSNLLKSLNFGKNLVLNSTSLNANTGIPNLSPFKLNKENILKPSFFEYTFIINGKTYRYNFSIDKLGIISEGLYSKGLDDKRERILFTRNRQNIRIVNFDDRGVKENVLNNHLALSKFASENSIEALQIDSFFKKIFVFLGGINNSRDTFDMLKSKNKNEFKKFLLDLLDNTSSGIKDINYSQKEQDVSKLPSQLQNFIKEQPQIQSQGNTKVIFEDCNFLHQINGSNDYIPFKMEEESLGTKKVFELAGSLFNVITKGYILFIDELDTSLSNKMIKKIIKVFKENQKNGAQLVFTTNNTNLLDIKEEIFRRDQIYFSDKNKEYNSTDLYTLQNSKIKREDGEFINIRKDVASIEKNYLEGKIKKI